MRMMAGRARRPVADARVAHLLFGHADRCDLRVGEDDPQDGRVVGPRLDVIADSSRGNLVGLGTR
jgi:hypothetical protein